MNFLRRPAQIAGPVDMDELADRLRAVPPLERPADEFAPKIEEVVEHIESFLGLPLKQLDDELHALEVEHKAVMDEGQRARDLFVSFRDKYLAQIERRRALTRIAKESFARLAKECAELDEPKQAEQEIAS